MLKGVLKMILDTQKRAILTMREQGEAYSKIANALGLSLNTVKSICRRNGVIIDHSDWSQNKDHVLCRCCGKPLEYSKSKGKNKLFCSNKCRYTWWNSRRRKQPYYLICERCGKQFISFGNRNRKYCGRECYTLSRYGDGLP